MGISSCCLNPLPPTSTLDFTSFPTSPKLVPRKSEEMRSSTRSWRQRCMVGLACSIVIGTEIGDYGVVSKGNYSNASELRRMESSELVAKKNKKMSNRGVKWSDKRSCPSWNINSLETIVPENLPRPYSHRKWDWVLNSSSIFTAPHLFKLPSKLSTTGCFSL